jgi:hypothetical protein
MKKKIEHKSVAYDYSEFNNYCQEGKTDFAICQAVNYVFDVSLHDFSLTF